MALSDMQRNAIVKQAIQRNKAGLPPISSLLAESRKNRPASLPLPPPAKK